MSVSFYFPAHFTECEVNPESPHCGPPVYGKVNKPGTPGARWGRGEDYITLTQ